MPIAIPDLDTTSQSVALAISTRLPGADATPPRSALGVLAKTMTGAIDGLYGAIETVASEIIYDTASEDTLPRWAAIWGLTPTPPTAATGQVTFTGASTTASPPMVPEGTVLARSDGVQYVLDAAVTLVAGSGSGTVTCTSAGAVTNTPTGTLGLTSPVAFIASTVTIGSGGLAGGADLESPESLLARLLLRIQQTPMGGSGADFVEWALGVGGVTRVWVFQWWQGAGTVGVTFMMDGRANPVPLGSDVTIVQAVLNAVRPVAAPTFVFAPTPVPLNFTIHLNPASAAIKTAVAAQLSSLIANQCTPGGNYLVDGAPVAGGTLDLTHIWASISAAAGEVDFTMASPTANITVPAGSITTMGAITWD